MSVQHIYASKAIGVTDLRRSDSKLLDNVTEPIAILKRDSVKGYIIPPDLMKLIAEHLDDLHLAEIAKDRLNGYSPSQNKSLQQMMQQYDINTEITN